MSEPVSPQKSKIAEREEKVLEFWKEHQVFKKSLEKKSPRGDFVFYDGPPFATGLPHYGHILAGTIKDVIPRFKTMQGYRVPRRFGWDCHGLPVENEVEKELGFKTKKNIEQYGIAQFNAKAREAVMRYADDWRQYIERMGRWVDMENDYRTMDTDYTESVWWSFKTLYEKGLIYEGFKSMHLCPRCETTLSNFEVTQGYKELTDASVYVKFKLLSQGNTYLLAWTTAPWTLPGNAALAVHPEHDYAFVEITASNSKEIQAGDTFIVGAKEEILRRVFSAEGGSASGGGESFTFDIQSRVGSFSWRGEQVAFSAKRGLKGKELIGQSYEPLFDYYSNSTRFNLSPDLKLNLERGWRVYAGEFVTEEDGTGIVHIAPAFGEDDYRLAVKEKLPFLQHVQTNGTFKKEITDFAGLSAKPKGNPRETDEKIAAALAAAGKLLKREPYTHEYPHCWRCDTPLLNFAAPSWFVKVSGMREKLVAENKKIRWIPRDVGGQRFGNWLAEANNWAISRSRYFGAPIPVWRCIRCGAKKAVGSVDELRVGSKEALTKCVFLRHGESVKNTKQMYDDSPDQYPLTRRGRAQAKAAAARLKADGGVDIIYTSPVRRAKETAEIVGAALGRTVKVVEDLREVDSGEWDGKSEHDPTIQNARSMRTKLSPEDYFRSKRGATGESWEDVERRMGGALKTILERHKGEAVLVVSHEGPIVFALKSLDTLTLQETDRFYEKGLTDYAKPVAVYISVKTGKEADLHRPFIDDILLHCDTCAKSTGSGDNLMRRVPEVFDCWYESGSMPFASAHYPFERDGRFDPAGGWWRKPSGFPADFIAEGLDQTRGWFYSMLVLGATLFGKSPYKSVVVNGIVLAENGAKMSKRLKNYPDPLEVVAKYGADALRYYLLSSPVVHGEELRFSEKGVDEVGKKVFNRLDNVLRFYLLYVDEKHKAQYTKPKQNTNPQSTNILDRWITARLNQLIEDTTKALEAYELDKATRPIGEFVDDLSTWYLRRSRERIKSEVLEERNAALGTLGFVLRELSKVMAPFSPFFAEYLYQAVHDTNTRMETNDTNERKSVHLEIWPSVGKVDSDILAGMSFVRSFASMALMQRAEHQIKVRQPLQKLSIKHSGKEPTKHWSELMEILKDEINIKEIVLDSAMSQDDPPVKLDLTMTPELKEEGMFRELARFVQEMRKTQGFKAGEFATLSVGATGASRRFVEQHEQELSRTASLKNIVVQDSVAGGEPFQADEILLSLLLAKQ